MTNAALPLSGVKIIEIGTMITAPLAASILAEMGAEVIKVERAGSGDPFRAFMDGSDSPHFRAYNKNKASVTIDLQSDEGKSALRALLSDADVLLENFRPGVMDRLGFSAETVARDYPNLVYCSITGFGADGPYKSRPAYDSVALALSGIANLYVDPNAPGLAGPTISDNITGMYAAQGIMAALIGRHRENAVKRVEVNMLEASIAFIPDSFEMAAAGLKVDRLTRVRASQSYAMTCADNRTIAVHLSSAEKFWEALVAAIDDPKVANDPRFSSRKKRYENYEDLQAALADVFTTRPLSEWVERLSDNDVPFSPILATEEVKNDPHVEHLGVFHHMREATGATRTMINSPLRFDGHRPPIRRIPPALGADNEEVLAPDPNCMGKGKTDG